jgi:uncharacterized membrane protein YbhN (UPF0104 family)
MKKGLHNYLIYISLVFLIVALIKADYLKIPTIHSSHLLLAAFSLLFVGFIVNTISQYKFLALCNYAVPGRYALAMVGLNIFGKYVPGKMWMAVGSAVYAAEKSGYSVVDLSVMVLQAHIIGIWCGLILGITGLLISNSLHLVSWIGCFMLFGLSVVLFSKTPHDRVERLINKFRATPVKLPRLTVRSTIILLPWFFSSWLSWGIGFYFLTASLTPHTLPLSTIFCFPLAGTLGILFLLAPGGIGIREGIMVGYLSQLNIQLADAITIAAASRLWFLIGEIFIFGLGFCAHRWRRGAIISKD